MVKYLCIFGIFKLNVEMLCEMIVLHTETGLSSGSSREQASQQTLKLQPES